MYEAYGTLIPNYLKFSILYPQGPQKSNTISSMISISCSKF